MFSIVIAEVDSPRVVSTLFVIINVMTFLNLVLSNCLVTVVLYREIHRAT